MLKLGACGGLKLGACGGLKLGIGGGVKPCGQLMLGACGGLKLGAGGGLKLGIGGGVKPCGQLMLGACGGLKLGAAGGLEPLGSGEALGAALLAAAGCDSLDGAGVGPAVDSGADDSGAVGWAFAPSLVSAGTEMPGPPACCALATGVAALFVAAGVVLFEAAGGLFAIEGGFDPLLLLLGSVGGVGADWDEEPGAELEHAARACITAAVETA
jgi:hypothetical protein